MPRPHNSNDELARAVEQLIPILGHRSSAYDGWRSRDTTASMARDLLLTRIAANKATAAALKAAKELEHLRKVNVFKKKMSDKRKNPFLPKTDAWYNHIYNRAFNNRAKKITRAVRMVGVKKRQARGGRRPRPVPVVATGLSDLDLLAAERDAFKKRDFYPFSKADPPLPDLRQVYKTIPIEELPRDVRRTKASEQQELVRAAIGEARKNEWAENERKVWNDEIFRKSNWKKYHFGEPQDAKYIPDDYENPRKYTDFQIMSRTGDRPWYTLLNSHELENKERDEYFRINKKKKPKTHYLPSEGLEDTAFNNLFPGEKDASGNIIQHHIVSNPVGDDAVTNMLPTNNQIRKRQRVYEDYGDVDDPHAPDSSTIAEINNEGFTGAGMYERKRKRQEFETPQQTLSRYIKEDQEELVYNNEARSANTYMYESLVKDRTPHVKDSVTLSAWTQSGPWAFNNGQFLANSMAPGVVTNYK